MKPAASVMAIEIIVPRLGWSMEEGVFVDWLKQDGEWVHAGEPLFRIEGDKAVQEIESIDAGVLRISPDAPKTGAAVRVGQLLGHLCPAEEARSGAGRAVITPGQEKPAEREIIPAAILPVPATPREAQAVRAPPRRAPPISPRALRVATVLQVDWTTLSGTGRTGRIRERDVRAAAGRGAPPASRKGDACS